MSAEAQARVHALRDLVDAIATEHDEADRAVAEGRNLGPVVEFRRLRVELGGWWPRGVTAMHAAPGVGKSAFVAQAVLHAECPAILLTAEMGAMTVLRRLIACESGDFLGRLRRGEASGQMIRAKATALAAAHPDMTIIDASCAPCTTRQLSETIAAMRQRGEHVLLAVDSVHGVARSTWRGDDEYTAVSAAMEHLRAISEREKISTLVICERSRAAMTTGGLHASAGTRAPEYSADVLIGLDTDPARVAYPDMIDPVRVRLTLVKNREGRPGTTIDYAFQGASMRFAELDAPADDENARQPERADVPANNLPTLEEYVHGL